MTVLCWSAWMSLKPPHTTAPDYVALSGPAAPMPPAAPAAKVTNPAEAQPAPDSGADAAATKPAPEEATTSIPAAEPTPESGPKPDLPAGSVGHVGETNGVVLRYNTDANSPEGRQWERLAPKAPLKSQDRLLNLPPFRTTVALGSAKVDMVGASEVMALAATPTQAARFDLAQGRVIVHGTTPAAPIQVQFAGRTLTLTLPAGDLVGLERLIRREPGSATAPAPAVRIIVPEGEVVVKVDASEETLTGPAAVTFRPPATWTDRSADPAPSWVTNPKPTSFDASVGEAFLKTLRPDRPVAAGIVEAIDDESKDVRRLAVASLRALGDVSLVVPLLSRNENSTIRRGDRGPARFPPPRGASPSGCCTRSW